jgi:hypothetical protein
LFWAYRDENGAVLWYYDRVTGVKHPKTALPVGKYDLM